FRVARHRRPARAPRAPAVGTPRTRTPAHRGASEPADHSGQFRQRQLRTDTARRASGDSMQIGFVGLGKMGLNMVTRLARGGHRMVAFDRDSAAVDRAKTAGTAGAASLDELVKSLAPPRAIWVMVPAGAPTDATISALADLLTAGDVIIDGGNTH